LLLPDLASHLICHHGLIGHVLKSDATVARISLVPRTLLTSMIVTVHHQILALASTKKSISLCPTLVRSGDIA
jgi:hypothetical protein